MNDVFVERMVKKKLETADILIVAAVLIGIVILSIVGFFVGFLIIAFPMISVLITAGAVFGGYKLISMRLLEFEYSLTNGFVSVDKIINKQSRKRLTSFDCENCEDIGEYGKNEERLKNRSFDTRVFATRSSDRSASWYMIVQGRKTGKTLLVFDPDEDLLEGIKKFIPRPLKFEKFGRG